VNLVTKCWSRRDNPCPRFEAPAAGFLVEPAELDGGLDREILFKFVLADFLAPGCVVNPDEGVAHLAEILLALVASWIVHDDDQLGDSAVELANSTRRSRRRRRCYRPTGRRRGLTAPSGDLGLL